MVKFLLELIKPHWSKWYTGLAVSLLAGSMTFITISKSIREGGWIEAGVALITTCFVMLLWWLLVRQKKNPKGQIGICVALYAESDSEHSKLQFKLVDTLKRKLKNNITGGSINLISLSNDKCADIHDHEGALKCSIETRSHLVLYGKVVTGNLDGKLKTSIQMDALVLCNHPHKGNRELFSREMRIAIPKQTVVDMQNDIRDFELLSVHIDFVARYIISIAAFLSGDFEYAAQLLSTLELEAASIISTSDSLTYVCRILPRRLQQVDRLRLQSAYLAYTQSRQIDILTNAEPIADAMLSRVPNDYNAVLHKSLTAFLVKKDINLAKEILATCHKNRDATWMYNCAFLYAYEGALWDAHAMYKRAFNAPSHYGNVPVESEEFIRIILRNENGKEHLQFAIALINYNAKRDFRLAAEAFEEFMSIEGAEDAWPEAYALSEKLLARSLTRV